MWIHERDNWPDFTWDAAHLISTLVEISHRRGRLLGRMEGLGFELKQEASLSTLTHDVVTTSAIEGENLNPEEVRSSIAKRLGIEVVGMVPSSRDVDGVVEMMLDATQNFASPLTKKRLYGWHALLFPTGYSGMNKVTVGAWRSEKSGAMQVVSGAIGKEKVHFEAPPAAKLKKEMKAFLAWFESEQETNLILKAGIAHLWFVTIHPFEDGNGRIGRAIADMALTRADQSSDRFYSLSRQIGKERKDYYRELECQQRSSLDITPWLDWFLACLARAIDGAEEILAEVLFKSEFWKRVNLHPPNERQRKVLNRMMDGFEGHLNTSRYAKLAKCSTDTALRDIKELLARSILMKNPGSGRSTSYRLAALDELKEA